MRPSLDAVPSAQLVKTQSMNLLIVATTIALVVQVYWSGGSISDLPVFLCLVGFFIIRWRSKHGEVNNEALWVFGLINTVAVMFALSNPLNYVIVLAAPLTALALAVLRLPRRSLTPMTYAVPVLMALITYIGKSSETTAGNIRDTVYVVVCVFIVGVVVSPLIRQFYVWLVELNFRAAEDNQKLETARDTLEHQVAERTRQLQEQNTSLDAARLEALRLSRVKTDFLATMSHEIRTPMSGILGMSELLLNMPLHPKQREYAQTVYESGEALMTVINDILDFSRLESGTLHFEVTDCDPRPICGDVLRLMSARATEKSIALRPLVVEGALDCCRADPVRLRQVLLNLIGNAVKFTDQGEVSVHLSQGNGRVRFVVQDSGIGIGSEYQSQLFQPFTQADVSSTRAYGGSGLGLAICKQLVERMNGEIGFDSGLGKGSSFWFWLPACDDDNALESQSRTTSNSE
ncbi:MAG: ATP-binding protein [Thermoflexales bacterium]